MLAAFRSHMSNRLSILGLLLLLGTSCQQQNKRLDFKKFSIEVPKSWTIIPQNGIDSYVGGIVIDHSDTLFFDLGWHSNPLEEEKPYLIAHNKVFLINKEKSTSNHTFYDYYGQLDTTDLEQFLKNSVSFETIAHRKAKIIRPKQSGIGNTGIYIDSLWIAGCGIDRFSLSGTDLKPANEIMVLKALRTIRFSLKR